RRSNVPATWFAPGSRRFGQSRVKSRWDDPGMKPQPVSDRGSPATDVEADIRMRFEWAVSRFDTSIALSWRDTDPDYKLEIDLKLASGERARWTSHDPQAVIETAAFGQRSSIALPPDKLGAISPVDPLSVFGYVGQARAVVDTLRTGRPFPLDFAHGGRIAALTDKLYAVATRQSQ
ncbi:MAG: hypothetical protein AAGF15_03500, partial [Pseudomonadota bacterium]